MDVILELICFVGGFVLGIFTAAIFLAASEMDRLEEHEARLRGE